MSNINTSLMALDVRTIRYLVTMTVDVVIRIRAVVSSCLRSNPMDVVVLHQS